MSADERKGTVKCETRPRFIFVTSKRANLWSFSWSVSMEKLETKSRRSTFPSQHPGSSSHTFLQAWQTQGNTQSFCSSDWRLNMSAKTWLGSWSVIPVCISTFFVFLLLLLSSSSSSSSSSCAYPCGVFLIPSNAPEFLVISIWLPFLQFKQTLSL